MNLEPLLTADAVAEYLGLRVKTVHQFVREGKLGCIQISPRDRRFTEEQIQAYLRSRTIAPPKPIDNPKRQKVAYPQRGGGAKRLSGDSIRAQLREEMRSWQ